MCTFLGFFALSQADVSQTVDVGSEAFLVLANLAGPSSWSATQGPYINNADH